jgi:hypothetical protein
MEERTATRGDGPTAARAGSVGNAPGGRRLSSEHRRFLWLDQGVAPVIFNFALNAGIAWLSVRTLASMPLWGSQSIAVDTIATAFILPLMTALVVTRLVGHQVAGARLSPLPPDAPAVRLWVARSSARRGTLLGLASIVVAAIPAVALLVSLDVASFDPSSFVWFKASFAALLAGAVTPLLGWWALIEASAKSAP